MLTKYEITYADGAKYKHEYPEDAVAIKYNVRKPDCCDAHRENPEYKVTEIRNLQTKEVIYSEK